MLQNISTWLQGSWISNQSNKVYCIQKFCLRLWWIDAWRALYVLKDRESKRNYVISQSTIYLICKTFLPWRKVLELTKQWERRRLLRWNNFWAYSSNKNIIENCSKLFIKKKKVGKFDKENAVVLVRQCGVWPFALDEINKIMKWYKMHSQKRELFYLTWNKFVNLI